jgi:uncharacterized metal-binding protein (TIGR02443 family)
MTPKKRFIAGASCTKCKALDRVVLLTTADDEWIECVECGASERRPTHIDQLENTVTNSPSKADEVGVVQFRPLR